MIDLSSFPEDIASCFFGGGYTEAELSAGLKLVPKWIPKEYWDFWRQFSEVTIQTTIFLPPAPYGDFENALEGFNEDFRESNFHLELDCFPVAYDDDYQWGIFQRLPDGKVICGEYDFEEMEYYRGPFSNFDDWVYSYRDLSDE